MKKIAVFTTSDIQAHASHVRSWLKEPNRPIMGTAVRESGETAEFCSWGKLEEAQAQGYHVYVVTSRSKFNSHDDWWIALVGQENIIQTGYDPNHGCANDPVTVEDWRAFIREKIGVEPDPNATTWMDLLWALSAHGIKSGRDFPKDCI